jgi:alpha-galactosidase/6-phospho-beta-glucosidase family protein
MAHWIIDTAGVGGIIVGLVAIPVLIAYFRMVRWIAAAPRAPHGPDDATGGSER